jgi:hypothetical protein
MRRILIIPLLGAALAASVVGVSLAQDDGPTGIDDVAAAEKPVAVTAPDDGRQVLVVDYRLDYEEGRVVRSKIESAEQIASIAPKVRARAGGDWLVTVTADQAFEFSFFAFDPARREVTPGRELDEGYRWVVEDGPVDWTLVVPLYGPGIEIDKVSRIVVTDVATRQVVIDSDL